MSKIKNTLTPNRTVVTVRDKQALKSNCVMIKGEFHIINEDCIKIGNQYYSKYFDNLYVDYFTKTWVVGTDKTVNGVVDYVNGQIITNKFELDERKKPIVLKTNREVFYVYNKEIFEKIPLIFNHQGNYYEMKNMIAGNIINGNSITDYYIGRLKCQSVYNYSFNREYSSAKVMDLFTNIDRTKQFKANRINQSDLAEFGDFSFGLEFETSSGNISEQTCMKYGLIPLRDGSITGNEFTTIPMQGEGGFSLLLEQLRIIKNNTSFDKECSLHIHFGNYPISKDSIFALYKVLYNIQDEVSHMFPNWIFNTRKYKRHGKDYCGKLDKFNSFEDLYIGLSGGNKGFDGKFTHPHPMDNNNERKWEVSPRYKWVNLINTCFKDTGKTVEFRIHTPTTNKEKIINWMFICAGILKYVKNNQKDILSKSNLNISLDHILRSSFSNRIYTQLSSYYQQRVMFFNECSRLFKDDYGCFDIIEDANQTFNTNIITD